MEENIGKVSVIVPCYNGEKFVDRCMSSIFFQEYPLVECIVVDDGSEDSSRKKIKEWDEKFKEKGWELIYFYQDNQGLGAAINAGLKLVTGKYIILLDIDDEYLPGAFLEKVNYLEEHQDVYLVRSNGWIINKEQKYLFINDKEEKIIEDVFTALINGKTNNWAGSYMVRSDKLFEFYPKREIYKSRYGQNLQLLLPMVYRRKCGFIDKPQMNYIRQETSLSMEANKEEREKKSLRNVEGYTDIRRYMVHAIVKDEEEKKWYLSLVEQARWRTIMLIASGNKNKQLMERAYKELKKVKKASIADRILYAQLNNRIMYYFYRVIRKVFKIKSV